MKCHPTFPTILTVALTAGINVSAMASVPTEEETQRENNNPVTDTTQPQGSCGFC